MMMIHVPGPSGQIGGRLITLTGTVVNLTARHMWTVVDSCGQVDGRAPSSMGLVEAPHVQ